MSSEEVRDELKQQFSAGFEIKNTIGKIDKINTPADISGTLRLADINLYRADALVRRASSLQQTPAVQDCAVVVHPEYANTLGIAEKGMVDVKQNDVSIQLPLRLDSGIPEGCAWLTGSSPDVNTLGSRHGYVDIT